VLLEVGLKTFRSHADRFVLREDVVLIAAGSEAADHVSRLAPAVGAERCSQGRHEAAELVVESLDEGDLLWRGFEPIEGCVAEAASSRRRFRECLPPRQLLAPRRPKDAEETAALTLLALTPLALTPLAAWGAWFLTWHSRRRSPGLPCSTTVSGHATAPWTLFCWLRSPRSCGVFRRRSVATRVPHRGAGGSWFQTCHADRDVFVGIATAGGMKRTHCVLVTDMKGRNMLAAA